MELLFSFAHDVNIVEILWVLLVRIVDIAVDH